MPVSRLGRLKAGLRDMAGRTWEAELILSAGVTFALIQLPGLLDGLFLRLEAGLSGPLFTMGLMVYTYVKLVLFVTIACFVVHLLSRAYWIALIGLQSAFPQGVRWEETQYGPVARDIYPRLSPSLTRLIDQVDRFGSSLFAFAFVMSAGFIISLLWIPILSLAAFAVRRWLLPDASFGALLLTLALVVAIPQTVAAMLDKAYEKKTVGPRLRRFIAGAYRLNYRLLGQRFYGPLSLTIFTNTSKRLMYPLALLFTVGLMGFFIADLIVDRGRAELSTASYVPVNAGARGMDPRHYEDMREETVRTPLIPSIPGDIVTGPYLRVFLPYHPRREEALLAERCPGVEPARPSALVMRRPEPPSDPILERSLACIAGLWTVVLNGDTLSPDFSFLRHPDSGARGIVAYLPTAELPAGRNLLFLERPDEPASTEPESRPIRYWIPFWK